MLEGLIWQGPAFWWPFGVGLGVAFVTGLVGGLMTEIGPWYFALRKPGWKPPDWAFGPVWTTIFCLAILSGIIAWQKAPGETLRMLVPVLFIANALFNILWNVLFFTMRRPDWALIETAFLWLSILTPMLVFWPFAPLASLCLVPYLLWVSIAWVLNWRIVQLNAPFARG